MKHNGYEAMIFVADSYLGKKGSLRYLFDNHLIHRYGYGLVFYDSQYQILPSGLKWCTDRRVPDSIFPEDHEVLEIERKLNEKEIRSGTIGVAGLNNTMKVEDISYLKNKYPNIIWKDASVDFESVRSIKSESEIEGVIEANRIIEEGFYDIVDHAKVGMTEEEAVSVAYSKVHSLGAKDTLFLTLSSDESGSIEPYFLAPRPRKIKKNDYLIISLEITGPTGHWVEFSRMLCFGDKDEETEKLANVYKECMEYARRNMVPGVKATEIQRGIEEIVGGYGYLCGHLSGHGIGMDVIERPFIALPSKTNFVGVESPSDEDKNIDVLSENMVISLHPQIVHPNLKKSVYMSDVFIIRENGAVSLSDKSYDTIVMND